MAETTLVVSTPDEHEILGPADRALAEARLVHIADAQMLTLVTGDLKALGDQEDELVRKRKKITDPLDASRKAAMDLFRLPLERIAEAKQVLKGAIADWNRRERERVAEEQRKIDEAAARERARLEEEAAKARAKAEQEARELAERAAAARAAGKEGEAAKLEQRAETKVESGQAKAASLDMMATAVALAKPVVAPPIKAKGTRETIRYYAEVTDEAAFKTWCAANPAWLHFLEIDEGKVNRHLQACGGRFEAPGLVVRSKSSIAA